MNTPEQEKPDSQIAAYALGALDLDEMVEAERALAASPEHQEELRQLREVVALLPFSTPPADPPAHVRDRLLARVAASQQPAPAPATAPASPPARARRGWLAPAALAALAALVLALGGLTLSLQRTVAGLDRTNRELVTTLTQLKDTLAATRQRQEELAGQLATGQQQIDRLNARLAEDAYVISYVAAPGVATRDLAAVGAATSARGEMYMYPGNLNAVVLFSGLPALAPGKVYQFWLADGQSQVGGGTFVVDEGGIATLVVEAPREVNAFSQVMVTVEPAGGSPRPSQEVVLAGEL